MPTRRFVYEPHSKAEKRRPWRLVESSGNPTAELLIGAADANGRFVWLAPANAPGFHGARFFVRSNHWVTVTPLQASLDDEGDSRCFVTWAAFKPRIVLPSLAAAH
jgi:hypothetical protein